MLLIFSSALMSWNTVAECGLTQRAPDWWESAHFTGFFLASGLYCSQAESRPAHQRVTQTVSLLGVI